MISHINYMRPENIITGMCSKMILTPCGKENFLGVKVPGTFRQTVQTGTARSEVRIRSEDSSKAKE